MKLAHLFSPVTINGMTLKNRAVMPPMGTGYGNADGTVSDRLLAYLERRAQGGTGLIITEVCAVDPRGKGFSNELGVWKDDFISGLARIPETLHRHGAKVALQLHHAGRETFEAAAGAMPEAPSAIPSVIQIADKGFIAKDALCISEEFIHSATAADTALFSQIASKKQ